MNPPSYAEIALTAGAVWTAFRWWMDRRDAQSALTRAKADADKTVKTLTDTVHVKDSELDAVRSDREYWMRRAQHAESLMHFDESA